MIRCPCRTLAIALLVVFAGAARAQPDPESASGRTKHPVVTAKRYMVVAANPHAADAGRMILARGGSAVDAAIAVQMVLNLVEPQSSGIGGGAFMLHFSSRDGRVSMWDGRETAPAAATADRFLGPDGEPIRFFDAVVGGRSVGVPGVLRMLEAAHRRHGKLPWASLFQPAIDLAEKGFDVSPRLSTLLRRVRMLQLDDTSRAYFYEMSGVPRRAGTLLANPELAATLRAIAAGGADAFYVGDIARDIVAKVQGSVSPGDLALEDLAAYRTIEREPLCTRYRKWKVCGAPPPSSGALTVFGTLGVLESTPFARQPARSPQAVHLITEAARLAYADRDRYVSDPGFADVPVEGLLDRAYLAGRARQIRPDSSLGRADPGIPKGAELARLADDESSELPSTSHVSIVDARGNAVALTTSIEFAFGSQLMVRGFLLNNQLTDFSFTPQRDGKPVANRIQPRKRPRSAMSPTLVIDAGGKLVMVIGSAGGSMIINHVVKMLVGTLDWGMTLQDAIDMPNFGSRNGPTELEIGAGMDNWAAPLRSIGHDIRGFEGTSGMHGIRRTAAGWTSGIDPRREGAARGE